MDTRVVGFEIRLEEKMKMLFDKQNDFISN